MISTVQKLVRALKFYANRDTYRDNISPTIFEDEGDMARQALREYEESTREEAREVSKEDLERHESYSVKL